MVSRRFLSVPVCQPDWSDWPVSPIRSGLIRRTDGLTACTCNSTNVFVLSAGERFEANGSSARHKQSTWLKQNTWHKQNTWQNLMQKGPVSTKHLAQSMCAAQIKSHYRLQEPAKVCTSAN